MSSRQRTGERQVLVVGAGPVGLTAAHELVRRGIPVRVVDRAAGPAVTSRATAIHARTQEVLDQMGLVDHFQRRGRRVEHFSMHQRGRRLIRFDTDYSTLPTRYPFTLQLDQAISEEILRDALRERGVEVEWGVELVEFGQDEDGVEATLRRRDGSVERGGAGWLVGADGGHSTVRRTLSLPLLGDSTETWLIADAVLDVDLPRDSLHWMHTGNGTVLLVPFPAPGKWRLLDTADVDGADDPAAVAARFAAKISKAVGRPVRVDTPSWVSVFTIQQRMIQQMRVGRCFVAGDAAHVHSPASGQGMNTGVQDAYNLAWKLADVIRGHAGEELLDTYAAERVPVGATLLSATRTATTLIALRNALAPVALPVGLGLLNLLKPVKRRVERKIMTEMSGLALHYGEGPLSLPDGADGAAGGRGSRVRGRVVAGQRVSCSTEEASASAGWRGLCEELRDPRWTLLVVPGGPADGALADRLAAAYGDAVSVRVLTAHAAAAGSVALTDPDSAVRTALGLHPGDYALIRPDGYLAGLGRLAGPDGIERTLRRVHLRPTAISGVR